MRALGFLVTGAVLGFIPRLAPSWCPLTGVDGSSTRELWLHLMGTLQIGIAMVYFLQRAVSALGNVMEYNPNPQRAAGLGQFSYEPQPMLSPRPAPVLRRPNTLAHARRRAVLPLPVAFKAGLLEQRRAA